MPQGHLGALLRVTRTGDDAVALDTDAGGGADVLARLRRFLLRTRCELVEAAWPCIAVRGPGAAAPDRLPEGVHVVVPETPGVAGYDLLGPGAAVPDGVGAGEPAAYEALRIEQGVPRRGSELGERTIPAEVGVVDRSVSFTKGCYTGQELVARVDSRGGNVPRRLRGVVVDGDEVPPPGAEVLVVGDDGEREVGHVTSAAASGRLGGPVALAFAKRGTDVPAPCTIRWADGQAAGRLVELPVT
jgi:folate-binding protein YgfZ